MRTLYTSESVTEGHPDKICDQISDAVLDAVIRKDPEARVACETCVNTDFVLVMGEITTSAQVDIEGIVRETIRKIGYTQDDYGFNADTCEVQVRIDRQSPDIAMGVNQALEQRSLKESSMEVENGAGDQGMMFGYATNETREYMPAPLVYAHRLTRELARARKSGHLGYLRPDGKAQVTVEYNRFGKPEKINTVVLSAQHEPEVSPEQMRNDLTALIQSSLPHTMLKDTKVYINPTGRFVTGGPHGDSGLTGRKIIVDTYGGCAHHGGGAFSGKDCTKVDRSAAYYARYAAKNIVAAGLAEKCEVQVSYAIGVAEPTSVNIETFGTERVKKEIIEKAVNKVFDFRPTVIVEQLDLRRPIYEQTASYGHFGRDDLNLSWEQTDKVQELLGLTVSESGMKLRQFPEHLKKCAVV